MIEKIWRGAPPGSYYVPPGPRPIRGVVLHHSAGTSPIAPKQGASWHYWVAQVVQPNGLCTVYADVDERHCAHGVGLTDVWRPPWVPAAEVYPVSACNYVAIHIEIQYAPQAPFNQVPSAAQYRTVKALLQDIYQRLGPLPVVRHGELDSRKWQSEPHGFNPGAAGLTVGNQNGWWLEVPEETEDVGVIDLLTQQKADLEAEIRGLNGQINDLNGVNTEFQRMVDALREELGARQADVATLTTEVAALTKALAAAPTVSGRPIHVEVLTDDSQTHVFVPAA